MSNELISVIVPVYNIAEYLPGSIGSILGQTYRNIEVVAVDDGSADESLAVLQSIAASDSRVRVIHRENGGVTKARLAGAAAAKGDWIGFVDGDDAVEPDMFERLLINAHKYHADISHCGYQMVFPSRVDYYYNTGRIVKQDRVTGLKDLISGEFIEPGLWNKLFHRDLFNGLLNSDTMDTSVRNYEDLLMNFYLFREAEKSVFEDFCPYHYMVRVNSAATSQLNEHKLRDPMRVMKLIRDECKGDPALLRAAESRLASRLIETATIPRGEQESLVKPYRAQARQELRSMVPELLRGDHSLRTKLHSAWASVWPWSYSCVHRVYARLRGTDNKYEVK